MIPNFLVFVPFGVIQFFRKRTKETNFIIIFAIISSLPIFYAYIVEAQDTRYLYFLYPIFSLVSLFAVKTYVEKFSKKYFAVILIIVGILAGSITFYEYKKVDYEKEKELYEIAKITSKITFGLNFHPSETRYIRAAELPTEWPFLFFDETHKIKSIPTTDYEDLEIFIEDSRTEITHLIVDDNPKLPKFLQQVYHNDNKYEYLSKVFDSREKGFKHQVKIFEIDFQKFDSKKR